MKRTKTAITFTQNELAALSDALLRSIGAAHRAASMVDSAEAREGIEAHVDKLNWLNKKICEAMED